MIKRAERKNKVKLLGRRRPDEERVVLEEPITDKLRTETTVAEDKVLHDCLLRYKVSTELKLNKELHKKYLDSALQSTLPTSMTALDASQPWILYWIANSLLLMDKGWLVDETKLKMINKLFAISPEGGPFGGGIGQLPHLSACFAAINCLALCDNLNNCWDKINREYIYKWLLSLKQHSGVFKTCLGVGDMDVRSVYCAISIASMLNILTEDLIEGVLEYIISCQTYEGGFGSTPHEDEAHGAYTFCSVASLAILGSLDRIDIKKLLEWCSSKQYNEEMGLCGRSNKLVDGCYSYWIGATDAILEQFGCTSVINKDALTKYMLCCCQHQHRPGLCDKPGKNPDFYHTNYVLMGLAIAQSDYINSNDGTTTYVRSTAKKIVNSSELLSPINPVYGLPLEAVQNFTNHFKQCNQAGK